MKIWESKQCQKISMLLIRKKESQIQSGCKLWFSCNMQKNDKLNCKQDFSNCNNVRF